MSNYPECKHGLIVGTCTPCKLEAGRLRSHMAPKPAPTRIICVSKRSTGAGIRPADPDQWNREEWAAASRQVRQRLSHESYNERQLDNVGRTTGPRDPRIKPLKRNKR